jgi:predicted lipoprotein with Yx(FWY)xxD motif
MNLATRRRRGAGIAVAIAAAGALALSACGSGGSPHAAAANPPPSAPPATAPAAAADVAAVTNAKIGQPMLVDAQGRSIYLFVPDGTSTQSQVPAQFKPNWPPVTAATMPVAGKGLDAAKLVEQTQADGTRQLAYNGHLLYRYIGDTAPGDTNGQGLGPNNWYLVSPAGDAIGRPMNASVQKAMNAQLGRPVLVDANGMTIYLFVPDGTSPLTTVPMQFRPNWPPVTASGTPVAGAGLAGPLAVDTQADGTRQLAYNGHLLYTFIGDKVPGDAKGQGLGPNNWFAISPGGDAVR